MIKRKIKEIQSLITSDTNIEGRIGIKNQFKKKLYLASMS
jgi:hypothetical protein